MNWTGSLKAQYPLVSKSTKHNLTVLGNNDLIKLQNVQNLARPFGCNNNNQNLQSWKTLLCFLVVIYVYNYCYYYYKRPEIFVEIESHAFLKIFSFLQNCFFLIFNFFIVFYLANYIGFNREKLYILYRTKIYNTCFL